MARANSSRSARRPNTDRWSLDQLLIDNPLVASWELDLAAAESGSTTTPAPTPDEVDELLPPRALLKVEAGDAN